MMDVWGGIFVLFGHRGVEVVDAVRAREMSLRDRYWMVRISNSLVVYFESIAK